MTILKNSQIERKFSGKRYICLVRQSNGGNGEWSTEAQLKWMHEEGARLGMIRVEDVILVGLTGSIPGKRLDLERLLQRKRDRDDFDVLLVQRIDRATRGGSKHGFWLEHECDRHGIILHYVGEDLPEDPHHAIWAKVSKYEAAYEQAKSIGQRSTQGFMYALSQERCLTVSRTPYGCDRLYCSAEGKPLFRIRALADGTQQKLDIDGQIVIETYGKKSRFRKQKDQRPLIIAGAPASAAAVRLMFELHYDKRQGGKRISDVLNCAGILSPTGVSWSQRQVESIYENPIYCGLSLGNVKSQGIFYRRGASGPEWVEVSEHELASRNSAPIRLRPPTDWVWGEQPMMDDFLPKRLRDKALPLIKQVHTERWARSQDPSRPKRSTSKHKNSEYILTDLLVDKEFGEKLSGTLCGKVGKKKRKYRHPRGRRGYRKGSPYNAYLPAPALEAAVLDLVLQVAANAPDLKGRILAAIKKQDDGSDSEQELAALDKQREDVAKRLQRISMTMTDDDLDDIAPVLDSLRSQRRSIDERIEKISGKVELSSIDPEVVIDNVRARMTGLEDIGAIEPSVKRDLLEAFVEKVVVDMGTKDVEVFLKLPNWALKSAIAASEGGRLAHSSLSPIVDETPLSAVFSLGYADCKYVYRLGERSVCYRCRRRAA